MIKFKKIYLKVQLIKIKESRKKVQIQLINKIESHIQIRIFIGLKDNQFVFIILLKNIYKIVDKKKKNKKNYK